MRKTWGNKGFELANTEITGPMHANWIPVTGIYET